MRGPLPPICIGTSAIARAREPSRCHSSARRRAGPRASAGSEMLERQRYRLTRLHGLGLQATRHPPRALRPRARRPHARHLQASADHDLSGPRFRLASPAPGVFRTSLAEHVALTTWQGAPARSGRVGRRHGHRGRGAGAGQGAARRVREAKTASTRTARQRRRGCL